MYDFDKIPAEMRPYKQWVTWRYEDRGDGKKPTKVLYNPLFNGRASVSDPSTWVSWDDALRAVTSTPETWAGMGFVLTPNDPYCFIDLDDTEGLPGHAELFERQNTIYKLLESYAEWSPSGKGLHIITKGSVERGRKRAQIEIYSDKRFMTMTGNVQRDAPIIDEDAKVKSVWHAMGGEADKVDNGFDAPQTQSNAAIVERMFNRKSGGKAKALYNGNFSNYSTQSEADFALLDYIAYETDNREQVASLFEGSGLYRSSKYANRRELLMSEIAKSFDRKVPTGGIEGFEGASPKGVFDFWPDPIPLPVGLASVAPFKPAYLPDALAPWVDDIGERMQCPPDYAASTAITAAGAVIGTRLAIRPKVKDSWTVVPNLWAMNVGRPGTMKSPAINEALAPMKRYENDARKKNDEALAAHIRELRQHKLKVGAIEAAYKKDANPTANIEFPNDPVQPPIIRRMVSDTTYEALGIIAAANPLGVLVHRDEISSLLTHLTREENAPARGGYLTGWNGTDSYTFDRVGRGHLHVDPLCISMIGSIQPGKLTALIGGANKGGEGDDGMMQRFNALVWPDQGGTWRDTDRDPHSEAFAKANAAFDSVNYMRFDQNNSIYDVISHRSYVTFDEAASRRFLEWRTKLEGRLRSGDLHSSIESHLSKYRKLVPALALINHVFDNGPGPVGLVVLERAISYSEYFETHAVRAYGAGLGSDANTAQAILSRIRKREVADEFTLRDIHQRGWSNLTDRATVKLGLDLLVDHRWLRECAPEPHPTGGRPTTRYQINPKTFA